MATGYGCWTRVHGAGAGNGRKRHRRLLIGEVGFAEAVQLLYPAQAALGREVNPKVFTAVEFSAQAKSEPILRDVLSKPKIFLIGNDRDLAELDRRKRV